jgi:hypothetical protein
MYLGINKQTMKNKIAYILTAAVLSICLVFLLIKIKPTQQNDQAPEQDTDLILLEQKQLRAEEEKRLVSIREAGSIADVKNFSSNPKDVKQLTKELSIAVLYKAENNNAQNALLLAEAAFMEFDNSLIGAELYVGRFLAAHYAKSDKAQEYRKAAVNALYAQESLTNREDPGDEYFGIN